MARMPKHMRHLYELCALALVRGRATLEGATAAGFNVDEPVLTVGAVGETVDIHPQTLRQYDRLGIVVPERTEGGARRYSLRDVDRLVQAQHLSQDEGINLTGVQHILSLQEENRELRKRIGRLRRSNGSSVFTANADGDIVEVHRSRNMRDWRNMLRRETRQLPQRNAVWGAADAADAAGAAAGEGGVIRVTSADTLGGGTAGAGGNTADAHVSAAASVASASHSRSRSMVLWTGAH
ncbi:transcriptional regulator, MerR family [Bifidobacterium gallicum DSM 20093 = LMG 11596]|uniref:Heat shock regulator protein HspR n=1 Tax=Bifidobacterium gallicum DSM 20093 = LMG 11596 TaxID=561180 RepID=D1NVN9_9BIFI|nr:transcriptional regulator, MerR family [Bifidobacterium gallicum DSM 20093 = LMG 11596]KFI59408.1 heat shock regulator protein HspR [Bifidobacterium gallicum DSM 20093 = LMG 11596]